MRDVSEQFWKDFEKMVWRDKVKLGKDEVMWFGQLYSRVWMRADPAKAQVIKECPSPRTVKEDKSLLRYLTKPQVKFKSMDEIEENFHDIKARLSGEKPERPRCTVTQAQKEPRRQLHDHQQKGETWRPVHHTARVGTTVEKAYSQIKKESLGVYSAIVANRMYLLGTKFEAGVDHKLLLSM